MRRALVLVALAACGGKLDTAATFTAPPNSNSSSSTPSSATSVSVKACTGAPARIYDGHPDSFAVDDAYVYVAELPATLLRIPRGGGTATTVTTLTGYVGSFAIGAGDVLYEDDEETLVRVAVSDDSFGAPVSGGRVSPFASMAFFGTSVYSGQVLKPGTPVVHRWPIDGAPEVDTALPTTTSVQAIVAAPDAAYAALFIPGNNRPELGSVARLPLDGSAPVTLAINVGEPTAIGVDDRYVYYAATRGGLDSGSLTRIGKDGTGYLEVTAPAPLALSVDQAGDSIYFVRDSAIWKVAKTGGLAKKIGDSQQFAGVIVQGDSVFWSAEDDLMAVPSGIYRSCK